MTCELCTTLGGELLWQDERARIVLVGGEEGRAFPGFCRVIWQAHVAEMADLTAEERAFLLRLAFAAEITLHQVVSPHKINLASLGNVTPHLHWHVIPRWRDDSHFPSPIWAAPRRAIPPRPAVDAPMLAQTLTAVLAGRLL